VNKKLLVACIKSNAAVEGLVADKMKAAAEKIEAAAK
jgi:hypothetical protein